MNHPVKRFRPDPVKRLYNHSKLCITIQFEIVNHHRKIVNQADRMSLTGSRASTQTRVMFSYADASVRL